MKENPFDKFDKSSEYLLPGEQEEVSINKIKDRIKQPVKVKSLIPSKWTVGIAASLFMISIYFLLKPTTLASEELAASVFSPYKNYQVENTRGPASPINLKDAYKAYDKRNFILAKSLFDEGQLQVSMDSFYYAISLQGLGNWSDASSILESVKETIPIEHKDAWKWHSSLNHIALDQEEQAIDLLNSLNDSENSYKQQAITLVRQLLSTR